MSIKMIAVTGLVLSQLMMGTNLTTNQTTMKKEDNPGGDKALLHQLNAQFIRNF